MRISDWSSDVCSSDLMRCPRIAAPRICARTRAAGPYRSAISRPMSRPDMRAPDLGPAPVFAALGDPTRLALLLKLSEIGRASCRERVCPYVYISVVPDYLKKKNAEKHVQQIRI